MHDASASLVEFNVMNVLELIRKEFKEFNVDSNRTCLIGHSIGGTGSLYLGSKYASNWAAIVGAVSRDDAFDQVFPDL
jgi:predicted peptidase